MSLPRNRSGHTGPTCRDLVTDYLEDGGSGTCSEIARAVGFARQTTENEIVRLRAEGSSLVANVIDGRTRAGGSGGRSAKPARLVPRERPISTLSPADTIAQALATRTPLEQAWR